METLPSADNFLIDEEILSNLKESVEENALFSAAKSVDPKFAEKTMAIAIDRLLRRSPSPREKTIARLMIAKVGMTDPGHLTDFLVSLNSAVLGTTEMGTNLRAKPAFVISREFPWTSFVASDPSPLQSLRRCYSLLVEEANSKPNDLLTVATPLLVTALHPFKDGNGRTLRLAFMKLLLDLRKLPLKTAFFYANSLQERRSELVHSMFDIRTRKQTDNYVRLFL